MKQVTVSLSLPIKVLHFIAMIGFEITLHEVEPNEWEWSNTAITNNETGVSSDFVMSYINETGISLMLLSIAKKSMNIDIL